MKLGIRKPSIKGRISARTSVKRAVRHRAGLKIPSGGGLITNPKKSIYNRVYRRTTLPCCGSSALLLGLFLAGGILALRRVRD